MTRPAVLLTRPRPASARFAAAVQAAVSGVEVVIAPLTRIVPVQHDGAALHRAPALVLTSVHAVPAAGPGAGRLALCVGEATAAAARAAGFTVEIGATGEAGGLLPLIAACPLPLLHVHGRHRARELPVPGVVVYDQQALPLPPEGEALLARQGRVLLPLFSPRSARLAAAATADSRADLQPLAISAAAAAAWGAAMPVAARPDGDAMLALVLAALREQSRPEAG